MRLRLKARIGARSLPAVAAVLAVLAALLAVVPGAHAAETLPAGFSDTAVLTGLTNPTNVEFAADGRVLVAEKSGLIKEFDSLADPTPTIVADLRTNVHNFWDRGLLGMALDPGFTSGRPYLYVLYTYDHVLGDAAPPPRWGSAGATSDGCPTPPGPTTDGCVVSGRLSRLQVGADNHAGPEQGLLEGWCQQFPSHSVGDLKFGSDGALYVSGGDGAGFNYADYGQTGNPCGDPPVPAGADQTAPTAEGGALRAQSLRRSDGPALLNGAILRLDPDTGAALPDNPLASSPDPNARRIVAMGMRNPFRFTVRPASSDLWIGDVGWGSWEEIDRAPTPTAGVKNFGWPCYEGAGQQPGYASLPVNLCTNLYQTPGAVTAPLFTYKHSAHIAAGDACPTGSSSITGTAFYGGSSYPARYHGALFFADYSRNCIAAMLPGSNGLPDPSRVEAFAADADTPVQLVTGPGGDLFYPALLDGTVHRISFTSGNQPPVARIHASPTSGSAPLAVHFDGATSTDPDPADTIVSYTWDLNGDGVYGDATGPTTTWTYTSPGSYVARLEVTDNHGAVSPPATVRISVDNTPPTASISAPSASTTWAVGDTISFAGGAGDAEDGTIPASGLSWTLLLHHCSTPDSCHVHVLQSFDGVASGVFSAPDHGYPSYLELQLTATDSGGLSDTASVRLDPKTVQLSFASTPRGLQLAVGSASSATPFTTTVIQGSSNSLSAPSPQALGGAGYTFSSWSDGGAQSHNITAGATPTSYTASYAGTAACPAGQYQASYFANQTLTGTPATQRCEAAIDDDWSGGSPPGTGLPADHFSVQWVATRTFAAGTYTFTATSDDGIRVWLDGTLLLNGWGNHGPTSFTVDHAVSAGDHQLQVQYYENTGTAMARFGYAPAIACPAGQYRASYFANMTLTGVPATHRCEAGVNDNWGSGSPPGTGLAPDHFSARWVATRTFAAGSYTFAVASDDGMRVFLDDSLVIDQWSDHGAVPFAVNRAVTAGEHELRVEYYEDTGAAAVRVDVTPTVACPAGQYQASYFANQTLTGTPATQRCEAAIDDTWGGGSPPGTGVGPDHFSVRWLATRTFTSGTYTFTATTDDGVRVWLDGRLIIDHWTDHGATTYTVDRLVAAGSHQVQVQYYDDLGGASASFDVAPAIACPAGQWRASYFATQTLTGAAAARRCEAAIGYNWGSGSPPGTGLAPDHFSVRWVATRTFAAGTYTFTATSDDGMRVFLDDTLLLNQWADHGPLTTTVTRAVAAGDHELRVEYYEEAGGAVARFDVKPPV